MRDEGVIREKRPGLYDLVDTMTRYIKYIGAGSKAELNDERAKLTKEKRIAAETENRVRKAELLEVGDVEKAYSAMMMNFRSRILALPQKLAPAVVALEGDEQQVQDPDPSGAGRSSGNSEPRRRSIGRTGGWGK